MCASGAVNTECFEWKLLCAVIDNYSLIHSVIHSFIHIGCAYEGPVKQAEACFCCFGFLLCNDL